MREELFDQQALYLSNLFVQYVSLVQYVMSADGSNPVNITNNPALDFMPSWSR